MQELYIIAMNQKPCFQTALSVSEHFFHSWLCVMSVRGNALYALYKINTSKINLTR